LPLISCVVPVFNGERYLGEAYLWHLEKAHLPNQPAPRTT
jgi:hypothetical protein